MILHICAWMLIVFNLMVRFSSNSRSLPRTRFWLILQICSTQHNREWLSIFIREKHTIYTKSTFFWITCRSRYIFVFTSCYIYFSSYFNSFMAS
nr:MAG TPA: hypothetical protein [Crassvirales sp.]